MFSALHVLRYLGLRKMAREIKMYVKYNVYEVRRQNLSFVGNFLPVYIQIKSIINLFFCIDDYSNTWRNSVVLVCVYGISPSDGSLAVRPFSMMIL